jgi:Cyanobacterial and plant NDH-1 subunit O
MDFSDASRVNLVNLVNLKPYNLIDNLRNTLAKFCKTMPVKKGDLVFAVREKLENSLEATASDTRFPPYIFETKGEIVETRGEYMLVKFGHVPTPNIWLRSDQLEKAD